MDPVGTPFGPSTGMIPNAQCRQIEVTSCHACGGTTHLAIISFLFRANMHDAVSHALQHRATQACRPPKLADPVFPVQAES
jgi:hypothetical protein